MSTLNCQAILFDLDGTLIESTFYIERLWHAWGLRHGVSPQYMTEVLHGRRAVEIIHTVAPHLSVADEIYTIETNEIIGMDGMRAYPGARELLNALPRMQWAIVTSGSMRVATARLNYAQLPTPDVFVTADDVAHGKPAPDAFLLAAKRLNIDPANCIVCEDSPAGIQAAKAAGMKTIAIASTCPSEMLWQADVIAQQFADIQASFAGDQLHIHIK
jgi:sugar-phosphatase